MKTRKKRNCGYQPCSAPLGGGKKCIVCKKSIQCPKCGRCVYCSGDFAKF
jgi:hypothetical protein